VALSWNQQTDQTNPTGVTAQINTWESELVVDGSVLERFKQNGVLANTQFFAAGWGIFFCPSSLTTNRPDFPAKLEGTGANTNASYGMNYYAGSIWYLTPNAGVTTPIPGGGSTDPKATNTSTVYYPHTMRTNFWISSHIVVTEAFDQLAISGEPPGGDPATINNTPTEAATRALYGSKNGVWLRHSKGANYLMGDGHAEWSDKYHTYNSTNPTVNREYSADPTGSPPTATDSSIWGHNPYGIRGYYR
jgi:prepilin-type processing-associated H-X9-DG protein